MVYPTETYKGIPVYDSNAPGNVIAACPISAYSVLTVPAYWRAMQILSGNLASFPRSVRQDGKRLEVSHPLDAVLGRKPNAYQNARQFWGTLHFHRAHTGNGFAEIKRTPTGKIDSLHNLLPEDVAPFRYDAGDGKGPQQWYAHGPTKRVLPAADVLHLSGLSHDGMAALDPIRLMGETFQRAKALDRCMTRYLMKGTVLRGAIQIPAGVSDEKLESIVNTLRTYFSGADADRDVIVLSDGATLNNATLSPQEGQIVQQGAYSTKQIAQITGVPPEFLYELSEAKYNASVEVMGGVLVRYTFRPLIEEAEDELSGKLLSPQDQSAGLSVHIDPDALLRGDTQTISATALAQVAGGLRTRNEGRAELGLPADPDPASDKLSALGDTRPQPAAAAPAKAEPPAKSAADKPGDRFAALGPILEAAAARVDRKTAKAFEARQDRPGEARHVWGNVFADQQAEYVREALGPVAEALDSLEAGTLDVDRAADLYAAAIRRQAAGGEPADLSQIINHLGEQHE